MNNNSALTHAIISDVTLNNAEKTRLLHSFSTKNNSIIPNALSNLAVKFNNLNPATQIILSILGFGIGRYLLDNSPSHDKMVNLDKPTNGYILRQ